MSARNSSGLLFLNVEIFSLYVSETDDASFRSNLILIMSHLFTSSATSFISGIGGISISDCTSMLSQAGLAWISMVVYFRVLVYCSGCHT